MFFRNYKLISLNIITIFTLNSCAVYTPQNTAPVFIQKKGELETSASINTSTLFATTNLNTSVALGITDKIQTQVSGNFTPFLHIENNLTYQLQGIIGYNFKINENVSLKPFIGYLYGKTTFEYLDESFGWSGGPYEYKGKYSSTFGKLQLTINNNSNYWGGNLKIGALNLNDNSYSYIIQPTTPTTNNSLLVEPSIFYSQSLNNNLRFYISYAYSFLNIKQHNPNVVYNNPSGSFAIGITYSIGRKNQKYVN